MKRVVIIAGCLLLSACATEAPKTEAPPPPEEKAPVYLPKPVTNLFNPWLLVRDSDVADARAFDRMINKPGVPMQTEVSRVAQKNDEGRTLVVDIWKGTNIGLLPTALKKRSPEIQRTVSLAAEFAGGRGEQARLIVSVSEADKPTVKKWVDSGLAKAKGQYPTEVQWKPLNSKKGDVPFIRIEPADPQYAFGPFTK